MRARSACRPAYVVVLRPVEALEAGGVAQRAPLLGRRAGDGDVALDAPARVDAVRRVGQRVVARRGGDAAVRLVVEHERGEEVDGGLGLRHVDQLALAAAPPLVQRRGDGEQPEARVEEVGVRAVGAVRRPVRPAGDAVQPAQRRALHPEPRVAALRPRLPAQAGAEHDEVGVVGAERLPIEAVTRHRAGREALDDHVRPRREVARDLAPHLVREVERDAELGGVEVGVELRLVDVAVAVLERPRRAQPVDAPLGLDAHDRRAVVGEPLGDQRPDAEPREVGDPDPLERARAASVRARRRGRAAVHRRDARRVEQRLALAGRGRGLERADRRAREARERAGHRAPSGLPPVAARLELRVVEQVLGVGDLGDQRLAADRPLVQFALRLGAEEGDRVPHRLADQRRALRHDRGVHEVLVPAFPVDGAEVFGELVALALHPGDGRVDGGERLERGAHGVRRVAVGDRQQRGQLDAGDAARRHVRRGRRRSRACRRPRWAGSRSCPSASTPRTPASTCRGAGRGRSGRAR